MSEKAQGQEKSEVPSWLWWGGLGLLATATLIGLGLVAALALGWRTPTPHRVPDWTSSVSSWHLYGDGTATVASDGYRLRLTQSDQRAWAVAGQRFTDFDLELDARALLASQDIGYGLLYRYQNQSNYYIFAVGGDGYYSIAVVREDTLSPLRDWQQWPHVRRGATTNRLRVRCEGAFCRFYINGEFTAETMDDTLLVGDVGLWAQTFSDNALDVIFEEMRLWKISERKMNGQ